MMRGLAAALALWLGVPAALAGERLLTVTHVAAEQVGARLEARVTLDTPAQARVFLLPAPAPRLVIDLPPATVALGAGEASAEGERELGPARLRFARHSPASTRLVFDLPAEGRELQVQRSLVGGDLRYVVSLSLAAPRRPARHTPRLQPARAERASAPLIVLDAGHGGRDSGARGVQGVLEKDITLAAALELAELLRAGGYRVRLTREDDAHVALEERVARARSWAADLFLSLHSDASSSEHTFGASVYTLSEAGGARAKRLRKARRWQAEEAADPLVSDILFDLSQQSSVDRSSSFAERLLKHLEGVGPVLRNPRRTAGFYVLLAPDVPAVLLEMGFLTNPEDESRLASPTQRSRLLQAVALAIDEHFASRTLLASSESGAGFASP